MASDPNFKDYSRMQVTFSQQGADVVSVLVRTQDKESGRRSLKVFTVNRTSTVEDLKDQLGWGDAYTTPELKHILKLGKDYLSSNQPENSKKERKERPPPPPPPDPNQPPNKAVGGTIKAMRGIKALPNLKRKGFLKL